MRMRAFFLSEMGVVGAAILGCASGIALSFGLYFVLAVTSPAFARIHPQVAVGTLAFSGGQDAYILSVTLGAAIGAFALLRRKMSNAMRAFWVAMAFPLLGMLALCSLISIADLRYTPHH